MLHVIIIKTTQFLLRKHLFFSFASAAYLQRKSLYLSLFDCQNLFTANKLIRLQRTRPGDRGINDAAKSTCRGAGFLQLCNSLLNFNLSNTFKILIWQAVVKIGYYSSANKVSGLNNEE